MLSGTMFRPFTLMNSMMWRGKMEDIIDSCKCGRGVGCDISHELMLPNTLFALKF